MMQPLKKTTNPAKNDLTEDWQESKEISGAITLHKENGMKKSLARNEKGFTLIELIVVIVILGILAAVAVPKYQDLTLEASNGAADGVLGAARGAATMNFAKNLAGGAVTPVENNAAGTARLAALIDTDYPKDSSVNGEVKVTINNRAYIMEITTNENTAANPPTPAVVGKKAANWPAP